MSNLTPDLTDDIESPLFPMSRRALLGGAAVAGGTLALGGFAVLGTTNAFAAATASAHASADFLKLSEFLTGGKPLDAGLAARFQAAMARHDAKFNESAATLQRYVSEAKAADIDTLLARSDMSEPLRKTSTQIVSAWYLGIVGGDENPELISYAQALMYRPTLDVLVVPTYGAGPDSWGPKPVESVSSNTEK